ncbi:MAG TPA: hypothetical protein VGO59_07670 [Verrucomicrobiae bacterium]|jgi:hypothetical protein
MKKAAKKANKRSIMRAQLSHTAWIENQDGDRLKVELQNEGGELLGTVFVGKIPYHVFFADKNEIGNGGECFVVDRDPDYEPKPSASGKFLLISPYAK